MRLEGWPRALSLWPWFETRRYATLLTMRSELPTALIEH